MAPEQVALEQNGVDVNEQNVSEQDVAEQNERLTDAAAQLRSSGYSVRLVEDARRTAAVGELAASVSPVWCERITVTVRCRLVEGAWQYELSFGQLVTGSVSALVPVLDDVLSASRR